MVVLRRWPSVLLVVQNALTANRLLVDAISNQELCLGHFEQQYQLYYNSIRTS